MTQPTTQLKSDLEKRMTEILKEFEQETGAKVTDVRYLSAGILSKGEPHIHIVIKAQK